MSDWSGLLAYAGAVSSATGVGWGRLAVFAGESSAAVAVAALILSDGAASHPDLYFAGYAISLVVLGWRGGLRAFAAYSAACFVVLRYFDPTDLSCSWRGAASGGGPCWEVLRPRWAR